MSEDMTPAERELFHGTGDPAKLRGLGEQIAEAAVRGELRGFTRAIDHTTIAAREAARAGLPFTTEAMR